MKRKMVKMPFGKHKGKPLNKIGKGYLGWVLANLDLDPALRADIQAVVNNDPLPPYDDLEEELAKIMRGE